MGYLILGISTTICALGWLVCKVGTMALVKYLMDKGCKLPSDEELKSCTLYVWKKMLHIR